MDINTDIDLVDEINQLESQYRNCINNNKPYSIVAHQLVHFYQTFISCIDHMHTHEGLFKVPVYVKGEKQMTPSQEAKERLVGLRDIVLQGI